MLCPVVPPVVTLMRSPGNGPATVAEVTLFPFANAFGASGEMLAEIPLPANATGSPISYLSGGKQFIVFPVGGGPLVEELIAVAL